MPGSVIVSGARTPIGKLSGTLASFSAMELGGLAIKAALERAGLSPTDVDYVFMGHVLQAGQGQITARQAAVKAGIPMTTPATTVNKVCLSGLNTVYLADQLIQNGDSEIVAASIPQRKGDPVLFETDEGVRPGTTTDTLGKLKPAFEADGTITAGNASQISDGGSATVIMSKAAAEQHGIAPLAELISYGQVAGPDPSLLHQPSRAIKAALDKVGKQVSDVD